MRLSLSELLLIFLIALVLLGPSVLPRMQQWLRRRGKQVGQSRRARAAEAAAAQREWDARMKRLHKKLLAAGGVLLAGWVAWLLLCPVQVQPLHYEEPATAFAGAYAPNSALDQTQSYPLQPYSAPVCVRYQGGWVYAAVSGGQIVRMQEDGTDLSVVLSAGGPITGFDFLSDGRMVLTGIDPAGIGGLLMLAAPDGWNSQVTAQPVPLDLTDTPMSFLSALCVGPDDCVYFAVAHGLSAAGNSPEDAYVQALLAHRSDSVVYALDLNSGELRPVLSGLTFVSGLTVDKTGAMLYVSDAGTAAVWQLSANAQGLKAGNRDVTAVLNDLPGRPAGLACGSDGRLWVTLSGETPAWLKALDDLPLLRRAMMNLPDLTRNRLVNGGRTAVLAFNAQGEILENWQSDSLAPVTGVAETQNRVYFAHGAGSALHWREY